MALGLSSSIGFLNDSAPAQDQVECTLTVRPDDSIQAAIDQAQEGTVICLAEGAWQEYLVIDKNLTLKGQGAEQTIIDGSREGYPQEGYPIVWIRTPEEAQTVSVKIEGLTIQRASGRSCTGGQREICPTGVRAEGRAHVTLSWVTIARNGEDPYGYGLQLLDSAQASVVHSTLSWNPHGIEVKDSAQIEVSDSTISQSRWGITLWDEAQATVIESEISGNGKWYGIGLNDASHAVITDSVISRNGGDGISLRGWARAEMRENWIADNLGCGISSGSDAEVQGEGNRMSDNGNDLCGNLSGSLRVPLAEPTEREITYPDPRYETLQQAVDALLPGGRLLLREGEHLAGLTIAKEVTIAASERVTEEVVLKGRSERNAPVLSLIRDGRLHLQVLKVTGGGSGLRLAADSQAQIEDSIITWNYWGGIDAEDAAGVELIRSTLSWNGEGVSLWLEEAAWLRAIDSTISEHGMLQVLLEDASELELLRSKISGKADGVLLRHAARATITESEISGTRLSLRLEDSAQLEITDSLIAHNEQGILLRDMAQAWIEENRIMANEGYGVALYLKGCGFEGGQETFLGRVRGSGNLIPGPDEPDGNGRGAVCPEELDFLRGDEQGFQVRLRADSLVL